MKSTAQLTKENNVKSLRLSNTDKENLRELYDICALTFASTLMIQS